jgi:hypothetical protein
VRAGDVTRTPSKSTTSPSSLPACTYRVAVRCPPAPRPVGDVDLPEVGAPHIESVQYSGRNTADRRGRIELRACSTGPNCLPLGIVEVPRSLAVERHAGREPCELPRRTACPSSVIRLSAVICG